MLVQLFRKQKFIAKYPVTVNELNAPNSIEMYRDEAIKAGIEDGVLNDGDTADVDVKLVNE